MVPPFYSPRQSKQRWQFDASGDSTSRTRGTESMVQIHGAISKWKRFARKQDTLSKSTAAPFHSSPMASPEKVSSSPPGLSSIRDVSLDLSTSWSPASSSEETPKCWTRLNRPIHRLWIRVLFAFSSFLMQTKDSRRRPLTSTELSSRAIHLPWSTTRNTTRLSCAGGRQALQGLQVSMATYVLQSLVQAPQSSSNQQYGF